MPPHQGFLLINKPAGWTSFDVVGYIRNGLQRCHSDPPTGGEESLPQPPNRQGSFAHAQDDKRRRIKVGHAGTLDPFAIGLLIVGIGRDATKRLDEFKDLPKTYEATIRLGATSNTGDPTGTIIENSRLKIKNPDLTNEQIQFVLKTFLGKQSQIPPMYSAKSVGGTRLYKLARQGKEVERQPNEIEIKNITLLSYSYPELKIEVTCSAGTYIRALAEDIGRKLGTGAYCEALVRTAIGHYTLDQAETPEAALTKLSLTFTIDT